ncbi:hypothetical protein RC1_1777 [Rhodospirillum centenum SW]|uniref:Uncharacterized protein n=1 Tax=Rhodospirillum centenum (strain ATCC 51521 / SW) TaxID=414684 RepID=B6ITF6_RHOCS|nr:hypothetical protein RC1_1777 [Rhodospirillum centenum SW]
MRQPAASILFPERGRGRFRFRPPIRTNSPVWGRLRDRSCPGGQE